MLYFPTTSLSLLLIPSLLLCVSSQTTTDSTACYNANLIAGIAGLEACDEDLQQNWGTAISHCEVAHISEGLFCKTCQPGFVTDPVCTKQVIFKPKEVCSLCVPAGSLNVTAAVNQTVASSNRTSVSGNVRPVFDPEGSGAAAASSVSIGLGLWTWMTVLAM